MICVCICLFMGKPLTHFREFVKENIPFQCNLNTKIYALFINENDMLKHYGFAGNMNTRLVLVGINT